MDRKRKMLAAAVLAAASLLGSTVKASPATAGRAEAAMEAGNYEYAYAQWKKILARWPEDKDAAEALARIDRIARAMFEEAEKARAADAERAKDLLRTVVLISDPGSDLNRRARQLLGNEA